MLVGLPGSGKSTYAKRLLGPNTIPLEISGKVVEGISSNRIPEYLSSDLIRKELYGDENIQGDPHEVFEVMKRRAILFLKTGRSVIYDATGVKRKDRLDILNRVKSLKMDIKLECHIVWARIETCIERNNNRERVVPESVIWRMVKQFETPWYDEGWNDIKIVMRDDWYSIDYFEPLMDIPHDNPHHPNTIKHHVANVMREVINLDATNKQILFDMAVWHDVGKVYTKTFTDSKGNPSEIAHYYQHQNVSAYCVLGSRGEWQNDRTLKLSYLVGLHMEPFFDKQPSNYWKKEVDPEIKKLIYLFNECDKKGA